MKLHDGDYRAARAYARAHHAAFPYLTEEQRRSIRRRARGYIEWRHAHPLLHTTVGVTVLVGLFAADVLAVIALPGHLPFDLATRWGQAAAALVTGALHGFLVCSIVTYSVHEGAAHDLIVTTRGRFSDALRLLTNNACRLFLADPVYYVAGHAAHHRDFGTPKDGSFTTFVRARRLLLACLPMAPLFSRSDFFPWRPQERTPSRRLSSILTKLYLAALLVPAAWRFGPLYAVISVLIIGSWLSFVLDRVREATEHAFLPLDRWNGTRDFGLGFFGLLLGGGPWGQPCHASHHLEPALAWYQQIGLHLHLRRILTPEQKAQLFLAPFVGFPRLLLQVLTRTREADARALASADAEAHTAAGETP